jgi:hypothetical protein
VPERVETTDPEGVDYGWVMQTTFVATIVVGAPVVAAASLGATLPTWTDRALFAVRVGAIVWIVTGLSVYSFARRRADEDDVDATPAEDSPDDGRADGAATTDEHD